ncbi:MAG: hypothetical protein HKP41_03080 [Desulfobacterales bacterium]|nr:hypothetical protein [Deltaproteobacteria bacterium]NNK93313.1 hypothetical protein [Desulfobacterales bacterium]
MNMVIMVSGNRRHADSRITSSVFKTMVSYAVSFLLSSFLSSSEAAVLPISNAGWLTVVDLGLTKVVLGLLFAVVLPKICKTDGLAGR